MRYIMQRKFWSMGGAFTIRDENEREEFQIVGKAFSWGRQLSFQDMNGGELAYISQKLMSWKPTYEIYRDDALFARVVREPSLFESRFTLDVPGPNDYTVSGSFWQHEFEFQREGRSVAQVSRKFWSWANTYGVDIADDEDDIAILVTCLVIDLVCHEGSGQTFGV